jgi:hypothetical protein
VYCLVSLHQMEGSKLRNSITNMLHVPLCHTSLHSPFLPEVTTVLTARFLFIFEFLGVWLCNTCARPSSQFWSLYKWNLMLIHYISWSYFVHSHCSVVCCTFWLSVLILAIASYIQNCACYSGMFRNLWLVRQIVKLYFLFP